MCKRMARGAEIIVALILIFLLARCVKEIEEPRHDNPLDPFNPDTNGDVFNVQVESRIDGIAVSWDSVTVVTVDGYRVYRSVDSVSNYVRIGDDIFMAAYGDSAVPPVQTYYYRVTAFRGNQESSIEQCKPAGPVGLSAWMVVHSPAVGARWVVGSTGMITWSSAGTSGSVKIDISRDGGLSWSTLIGSTADSLSYEWGVDAPISNSCRIRVADVEGTPLGMSDLFSIVAEENPYLTVISPSAGEDWPIGSAKQIEWSSSGTSGSIDIGLSRDGGETWENIEESAQDNGEHGWEVSGPGSSSCYVRISDVDGTPSGMSGVFVISEAEEPYIVVTSPAIGQDWEIGRVEAIEWSSSGSSGSVEIELSRDGGSEWEMVASSEVDDGSIDWMVDGPASTDCQIRITDVQGSPSGTGGTFTISEQPYITITSPAAGSDWQIGSNQQIEWTSVGTSGQVDIEISRDGGTAWSTIADSADDDGDSSWTVEGPASTSCQIRISDVQGSPSATSGVFSISEQPYITITSPAAGADWQIGSNQEIEWTSVGTSGQVDIEISRDGGTAWSTIADSADDDGDSSWTVEGPASTSCQIRIRDVQGSPSATSGVFSISEYQQPFLWVTAPAEGEEWGIGTYRLIEWSSQGTSGEIDIEVSRDGGSTWFNVIESVQDSGSYGWTVAGPAAPTCQIKVSDVEGDPAGISAEFSIVDLSSIELASIPGGSFEMGYYDEDYPESDQIPEHTVSISAFNLSKYEITQAQYAEFDSEHESHFEGASRGPVEKTSWYDAARFCNWLSEREGRQKFYDDADLDEGAGDVEMNWSANGYRLPTEAEWEYACRAGTNTHYHNGDTDTLYSECEPLDPLLDEIGWYCGNTEWTHDVGMKEPNDFGLFDMSGNVYEWCNDWYLADYYQYSPAEDPQGPDTGLRRVERGGSWYDFAYTCRSANRFKDDPGNRHPDLGFRVARSGE